MASKYTHDVVATNGEYQSNGETKKRYVNVGKAFTDDSGRISIKLDSIPVGPDWSGWLSLYEPKARDAQPTQQRQQPVNRSIPSNRSANQNGAPPPSGDFDESDDIPF